MHPAPADAEKVFQFNFFEFQMQKGLNESLLFFMSIVYTCITIFKDQALKPEYW